MFRGLYTTCPGATCYAPEAEAEFQAKSVLNAH